MFKKYAKKIFDGTAHTDTNLASPGVISVTVENPYGSHVLLLHDITSGSTGGFCTLYHTPDKGTTKIAHQGGQDDENVKTTNQSTGSYAATYHNVGDFTITLSIKEGAAGVGGTHDVWVIIFGDR